MVAVRIGYTPLELGANIQLALEVGSDLDEPFPARIRRMRGCFLQHSKKSSTSGRCERRRVTTEYEYIHGEASKNSVLQETKDQKEILKDHLVEPSGLTASDWPTEVPPAGAEKSPYRDITPVNDHVPSPRLHPLDSSSSSSPIELSNRSEKRKRAWYGRDSHTCTRRSRSPEQG